MTKDRRRGRTGAKIALALGTLVVALVAAEVVTRLVVRADPPFDYMPFFRARIDDPDTGWRYPSDWEFSAENEEGETCSARTSGEGFFTPDVPAPETRQLVVLGDSFLAAFPQVRRPIAVVLRDELDLPVYNLAAAGWGPESYRAAYEKLAARRNHELVVVFTFMNDIMDVPNFRAWKASAEPSFSVWLLENRPALLEANTGTSWPDRHSILWNWGKYRLGQLTAEPPDLNLERIGTGDATAFELHLATGYPFMQLDPDDFVPGGRYFPAIDRYLASLERLRRTIEGWGARMVLVWIPTKERVHLPLLASERLASYVTNETGAIDGLEALMAFYAGRVGVPLLDLTPALTAQARAGEQLYFRVDPHFNSAGSELVGRLVADFVRGLPDAAPAPTSESP